MSKITIPWDDGSGDNLYWDEQLLSGNPEISVTSDTNNTGVERKKTLIFKTTNNRKKNSSQTEAYLTFIQKQLPIDNIISSDIVGSAGETEVEVYFLIIKGLDYITTVNGEAQVLNIPIETNGTINISYFDTTIFNSVRVSDDNKYLIVDIKQKNSTGDRQGVISLYLQESQDISSKITVLQSENIVTDYFLKVQGVENDIVYSSIKPEGGDYSLKVETNGTPKIVSKDDRIEAEFTYEGSAITGIKFTVPENRKPSKVTYESIIIGINEDESVRRTISISQLESPYYLLLNGSEDRCEVTCSPSANSFRVSIETNGTPKVMPLPLEYLQAELSQDKTYITFTLDENNTKEDRIINALITLEEDSSIQRYVYITQYSLKVTFYNAYSKRLLFKNPDLSDDLGKIESGSKSEISPMGDIGFYQEEEPAIVLEIISTESGVECGHWESDNPQRYVFELEKFKTEVYNKTGETEVTIKTQKLPLN